MAVGMIEMDWLMEGSPPTGHDLLSQDYPLEDTRTAMTTKSGKMASRPFFEAVEAHCEALTKEELVAMIVRFAEEAPVAGRGAFLDTIRSFGLSASLVERETEPETESSLIERVEILKGEIRERIEAIEDGAYWEIYGDGSSYDYGEEPDYVSAEQIEELEEILLETGDLFVQGGIDAARRLYGALFDLLDEHGEIHYPLTALSEREARARYCRSVYETADPSLLVDDFFECMGVESTSAPFGYGLHDKRYPMLQDVLDARPGALPAWDLFLPAWERRLAACGTSRAALLRLEAVHYLEGIQGVARLAREWASDQACGYLYWLERLEEIESWDALRDASLEALAALPQGRFREQAADCLTKAASELGDEKILLQGKRERFLSAPNEHNLLSLIEEAERQAVRSHELELILAQAGVFRDDQVSQRSLRTKILLMAGQLEEAFREGQDAASLGWSHGKAAVLFASVLAIATDHNRKASCIQDLLREYSSDKQLSPWESRTSDAQEEARMHREIVQGLKSVQPAPQEIETYLGWAERTGRERIEAIVSNQHRGAYHRAAQVLTGLAECLAAREDNAKAESLIKEYTRIKFPRHSAFRSEVRRTVEGSALLKGVRIS